MSPQPEHDMKPIRIIDISSNRAGYVDADTPCLNGVFHDGVSTTTNAYATDPADFVEGVEMAAAPDSDDADVLPLSSMEPGKMFYLWDPVTRSYWVSKLA